MTLEYRIRKVEGLVQVRSDGLMEPLIGDDGKPVCCSHGQPYQILRGWPTIVRVVYFNGKPDEYVGLPPCRCQTNTSESVAQLTSGQASSPVGRFSVSARSSSAGGRANDAHCSSRVTGLSTPYQMDAENSWAS